jgi:hypothetical protein
MTFDDPAVADEFSILSSALNHPLDSGGGPDVLDSSISWAFARLLTPDLSIGANGGWIRRSGSGFPIQGGFDETSLTLSRPILLCRWRRDPASGKLVCGWEAESFVAEPGPRCRPPRIQRSTFGALADRVRATRAA